MFKKVKKFLIESALLKRAFLGLFVFLFLFLSVVPNKVYAQTSDPSYFQILSEELQKAYSGKNIGQSFGTVGNAIMAPLVGIPAMLIGGVFWVLAVLTGGLLDIAKVLLQWVLSGDFVGDISYTNPDKNPVIKEGLKVTQSFVNMILVLVLVFISLTTILRLKEYESKKLLVNFVIIALLVNFAPVICGLIVDASNITMNFFIKGINAAGSNFVASIKGPADVIKKSWNWEEPSLKLADISKFATEAVALTIFNFFAFFIYLAFAMIFIVRYMAIWVLVILSPIAFACYVLPITKRFWTMWWNQFVQWCIIGITCAFFLHLSEILLINQSKMFKTDFLNQHKDTVGSSVLTHLVPLVFLALALVVGLQTAAMGASTIINWSTKARRGVARKFGIGAGRMAQDKLKTRELANWASSKVENIQTPGLKTLRWFWPETIREYGQSRGGVEKAQSEAKSYSSGDLMRRVASGDLYGERATGAISEVFSRGDSNDIINSFKNKLFGPDSKASIEDVITDKRFLKTMKRPLEIAQQSGLSGEFFKKDPRLARLKAAMNPSIPKAKMKEEMEKEVGKMINEIKPGDINSWGREVLEDQVVVEKMMGREKNIWQSVQGVKGGVKTAQETIDKNFTQWVDKTGGFSAYGSDNTKAWEAYEKSIGYNKGYFRALREDPKFSSWGWRAGEYAPIKTATPPVTPGAATTGPTPTPATTKNTGKSRRKPPIAPKTGKPPKPILSPPKPKFPRGLG